MIYEDYIDALPSRAHRRGAIVASMMLTTIGFVWALLALINWSLAPSWSFGVVSVLAAALLLWSGTRLRSLATQPVDAVAAATATAGRKLGVWFGLIFAAEGMLIAATSLALALLERPLLIPVAIVAIVGAHFLPLARLFRMPIYWVTGGLLLMVAGGSLLIGDEALRLLMVGLSTALVLWGSAAALLIQLRLT